MEIKQYIKGRTTPKSPRIMAIPWKEKSHQPSQEFIMLFRQMLNEIPNQTTPLPASSNMEAVDSVDADEAEDDLAHPNDVPKNINTSVFSSSLPDVVQESTRVQECTSIQDSTNVLEPRPRTSSFRLVDVFNVERLCPFQETGRSLSAIAQAFQQSQASSSSNVQRTNSSNVSRTNSYSLPRTNPSNCRVTNLTSTPRSNSSTGRGTNASPRDDTAPLASVLEASLVLVLTESTKTLVLSIGLCLIAKILKML